jgi:hypothetical protein
MKPQRGNQDRQPEDMTRGGHGQQNDGAQTAPPRMSPMRPSSTMVWHGLRAAQGSGGLYPNETENLNDGPEGAHPSPASPIAGMSLPAGGHGAGGPPTCS